MKYFKSFAFATITTLTLFVTPAFAEDDVLYGHITFANDTSYNHPAYLGVVNGKKAGVPIKFGEPTEEAWDIFGVGDVDGDGWENIWSGGK